MFIWKKLFPVHKHCIKSASFLFTEYAWAHEGMYPVSKRGWGDALLLLVSGPDAKNSIQFLVGVGDDGSHFRRALRTSEDVSEGACTRIYVQGLTTKSAHEIALLFDRKAIRGGDHFRSPFARELREVVTVGGWHKIIENADWPAFVRAQRKLLHEEGFTEKDIDGYYESTLPN